MKLFAVLALCVAAVSAEQSFATLKDLSANGVDTRIINGQPAGDGQFPWQVAVNFKVGSNTFFCGGALISDTWILTAAHCVDGASEFTLRFGSTSVNGGTSQTVSGSNAIQHEGYSPNTLNNDVALIRLNSPVSGSNIAPIALPASGDVIQTGDALRVSGWGKTSDNSGGISSTLQFVDLTAISNQQCQGVYGSIIISSTVCCDGSQIRSTCNGDSGGPLTKNGVHAGVVSFVSSAGCESGNPSGFVRTESMLPWIRQNSGLGF